MPEDGRVWMNCSAYHLTSVVQGSVTVFCHTHPERISLARPDRLRNAERPGSRSVTGDERDGDSGGGMEQRHLLMDLSRRVFLLLLIPALLTQAGGENSPLLSAATDSSFSLICA